jgi:cell division protein FtsZ
LSLSEASEATALITKVADPDANVIYGIVTDESMGNAVKVTVIATGFSKGPRKAVATPVDLANYMTTPQSQAGTQQAAAAAAGDFYRKTPNAKAASGGSRFDLDVPAFLRRKGSEPPASGGE